MIITSTFLSGWGGEEGDDRLVIRGNGSNNTNEGYEKNIICNIKT